MKIYLSGPMRGYPLLNFPAFHAAAAALRLIGHEVFNPAEKDDENGEDDQARLRILLGADLAWITAHADAVAVLPGWCASLGALAETATARALGLPVLDCATLLETQP